MRNHNHHPVYVPTQAELEANHGFTGSTQTCRFRLTYGVLEVQRRWVTIIDGRVERCHRARRWQAVVTNDLP